MPLLTDRVSILCLIGEYHIAIHVQLWVGW
jgi:hypothetical protein